MLHLLLFVSAVPMSVCTYVLKAFIHDHQVQLMRITLGKAPLPVFNPTVHTGKLTTEKLIALRDSWVRHVMKVCPEIVALTGYSFVKNEEDHGDAEEVLLAGMVGVLQVPHIRTRSCRHVQ